MAEGNPQLILERGETIERPPALIMQGTADDNLTPDMAANFAAAYTRTGGSISFHRFEGQPHAFIARDPAAPDAVRALAEEFGKQPGQQVELTFDSAQGLQEKINGGAIFDALIASEASMDALDSDGIVNPESRVRLASAGTGMDATYEGALMSDGSAPQAARAFIQFLASEDASFVTGHMIDCSGGSR